MMSDRPKTSTKKAPPAGGRGTGDGAIRQATREAEKAQANAVSYRGAEVAPPSRQVMRRRELKAIKRQRAADRAEALRTRRSRKRSAA